MLIQCVETIRAFFSAAYEFGRSRFSMRPAERNYFIIFLMKFSEKKKNNNKIFITPVKTSARGGDARIKRGDRSKSVNTRRAHIVIITYIHTYYYVRRTYTPTRTRELKRIRNHKIQKLLRRTG